MKRIGVIAAALIVPLTLAVGCQGSQPSGAGPAIQPKSTTPTSSASTVAVSPPTSAPPTNQSARYPDDYLGAVMAAWSSHDIDRLALLTSDPQDFLAVGNPDQHWTKVLCDGAMGSLYCTNENRAGDVIIIRVPSEGLISHKWHIATLFRWDAMTYPNDAKPYAEKFVNAWITGYSRRMLLLSTQPVVDYFKNLGKIDMSFTIATDGAAGHTYARITNGTGFDQTITIVNEKVFLRLPHAIDGFVSAANS